MKYLPLLMLFVACSCSNKIYIVRHAEKAVAAANMSSDVALSPAGEQRAIALKEEMKSKKLSGIYSTNTIRTKTTAQPTATHFSLAIDIYGPRPDSTFINLLKSKKGNLLVVGHSNTIDDIANKLAGKTVVPGDLPETDFDNLYILKRKGKKFLFSSKQYGVATN